jgi:hypothetical protein
MDISKFYMARIHVITIPLSFSINTFKISGPMSCMYMASYMMANYGHAYHAF